MYLFNLYTPFQMGAQAYAYDVRAVVQEQVESLGGIFLRYIHTYIHTYINTYMHIYVIHTFTRENRYIHVAF